MTAVVWFRRDLRLHEHPALHAALEGHDAVIPFFCLDGRLLHGRHESGPRTRFMLECLRDLDGSLRERGSGLVIRHGAPAEELAALVAETGAAEVHFTADVTPYARSRGERVRRAVGAKLFAHPGLAVVDEPGEIRTRKGKPHTVFSPYHRAWLNEARREVREAPQAMPALPSRLPKGGVPAIESLGIEGEVAEPARGGEGPGRERMDEWLRHGVARYHDNHDALGEDRTSRLSPYLRFGCVSARELEERLGGGAGGRRFAASSAGATSTSR